MYTLSREDLLPTVDVILNTLEEDEDQFYVVIEVVHQLRAELTRVLDDDE